MTLFEQLSFGREASMYSGSGAALVQQLLSDTVAMVVQPLDQFSGEHPRDLR